MVHLDVKPDCWNSKVGVHHLAGAELHRRLAHELGEPHRVERAEQHQFIVRVDRRAELGPGGQHPHGSRTAGPTWSGQASRHHEQSAEAAHAAIDDLLADRLQPQVGAVPREIEERSRG